MPDVVIKSSEIPAPSVPATGPDAAPITDTTTNAFESGIAGLGDSFGCSQPNICNCSFDFRRGGLNSVIDLINGVCDGDEATWGCFSTLSSIGEEFLMPDETLIFSSHDDVLIHAYEIYTALNECD
jgi:hypothetical protein